MPNSIKTFISIIVALVAWGAARLERDAGHAELAWLVLGLGGLMITAMWLFPEHVREDKD